MVVSYDPFRQRNFDPNSRTSSNPSSTALPQSYRSQPAAPSPSPRAVASGRRSLHLPNSPRPTYYSDEIPLPSTTVQPSPPPRGGAAAGATGAVAPVQLVSQSLSCSTTRKKPIGGGNMCRRTTLHVRRWKVLPAHPFSAAPAMEAYCRRTLGNDAPGTKFGRGSADLGQEGKLPHQPKRAGDNGYRDEWKHRDEISETRDHRHKRTPDEAEELLARISRNHDDWNTPEPTPTPILKKRGLIELNDEDMREAKKSLKEKGIKSEDVKNLPPIEDICEIIPPSSMIEDPLYPEGHPKRIEQDSQRIEPSAPSKKKKKKKHKNVVESSEPVNDPNSISISDAETESGKEHNNDNDNDKNDASDKEEVEDEPDKHDKNKKYSKEDFIAKKHGAVIDCNKGKVTFNVDDKEHTIYFPKRIDKKSNFQKILRIFGKVLFSQNIGGAKGKQFEAPHHRRRAQEGPRGPTCGGLGQPPTPSFGLFIAFDLKTHGEKSKSPKPSERRHIAKLRLGSRSLRALQDGESEEIIAIITTDVSSSTSHVSPIHEGHHDIDDDEELVAQGDNLDDDNNLDDDEEVPLASVVREPHLQDLLLEKTKGAKRKSKLEPLEIASNTPLYDSGRGLGESRLRVALDVLQMKAKHGWTDTSVDDILEYVKDLLPAGNTCPGSLAEAKRITCPLDLPHEKYHACINDCIMYRKEHMDKTKCPVCEAERYKKGKKKAPRKVVWYFPLSPRLQRFYADRKEAKLMRWHAERKEAVLNDEERIEHPVLTHPSDASQWKALDNEFGSFGADPRNIRLGASTDGFNPFGNQSSTHSTWPMFVWIYNLPPWLCMKRKYI
ncbi:hypothetical protein QYE76_028759 [Lolium multiflorum]|uniref:Uncharacterized protein n=1 Tax=Lolium multiflorum TaxID=4521 RepID=A0AAD8QLK8_LOLMU|nr:hypothetical protein QYE76_028759 [Lolium multiflorum]